VRSGCLFALIANVIDIDQVLTQIIGDDDDDIEGGGNGLLPIGQAMR
jgi:hypothetical protein